MAHPATGGRTAVPRWPMRGRIRFGRRRSPRATGCVWSRREPSARGSGGRRSASTARAGWPTRSAWRWPAMHPIGDGWSRGWRRHEDRDPARDRRHRARRAVARRRGCGVLRHRTDQSLHPAPAAVVLLAHPAGVAVPAHAGPARHLGHRGDPAARRQAVVGVAQAVRAAADRRAGPAAGTRLDPGAGGVDDVSAVHRADEHRAVVRVQVLLHHKSLRDGLCRRGAVLVHIAVKLPVIRRALGEPVDDRAGALAGRRGARCCAAPGWPSAWPPSSPRARRCRCCAAVGAGAAVRSRAARGSGEPVRSRRVCCAVRAHRTTV